MTRPLTPYLILQMRETLRVQCLGCQHDAAVDTISLIDQGMGDTPIATMRFRCTQCQSIRANPRLDRYPDQATKSHVKQ